MNVSSLPEHDTTYNTYGRAVAGYDEAHEHALAACIVQAIGHASILNDCKVMAIRTGETASALLTVLASVLAMSPSTVRSPASMRKTVDELGKRLRQKVAAAESNQDMQAFKKRCFNDMDVGGTA
jgi:hypothetical protein